MSVSMCPHQRELQSANWAYHTHTHTHIHTHTQAQSHRSDYLPAGGLMCIVTTVCPHCQGQTPIWPQSSQPSATHLESRNKPASEHSCLSPSVSERSVFGSHHTERWETLTGDCCWFRLKTNTETSRAGCQINYRGFVQAKQTKGLKRRFQSKL